VIFVAEFLCLDSADAKEFCQVLDLLFVDVVLVVEGELGLADHLVGVLMRQLELLEHLVHVPLGALVAVVDSLLAELDVSLHFLPRNRGNIVVCRDGLEDLISVFLDDVLLLDHLGRHLHLHQTVSVIYLSLALLTEVESIAEEALVPHSDDAIFIPTLAAYHSVIYQHWHRFIFILEVED